MAEKLTASAWTSFAKKKALDDGALVKSLTKFEAIADDKYDALIDALEDVVSQLNKLIVSLPKKKPPLPDKELREVKDKAHGFLEVAERALKDARSAKVNAASEDDDESPALLTTKMVPLLREVKKGGVQLQALVAMAGKATAVLIMRRTISPAMRKLLAGYLDATGGLKYSAGHCELENNVVTFVLQTEAAGMAKRIRQAILDQTGQRLKVRVRGIDGNDEDGEDEGEQPAQGADGPGENVGGDIPTPPSPDALNWQQRWPRVRAAVTQALDQGQHPEAAKLRAVLGFANDKGAVNGDFVAGLKALDTLEQLLKSAPQAAAAAAAPAASGSRSTVAPAIVYTQTRLAWVATRSKVKAELDKLEKSILAHYQGNEVLPNVVRSVRKLDSVLEMFDESLTDQLDKALNATDAAEKARCHDEARQVIARYQGYLASDPFVQELDGNPFIPISVRSTLDTTLKTLASKIV